MKTKSITRPLEIKAIGGDGEFSGYGSVFGTVDSYRDIVLPGAFTESLADHHERGSMPALLWQHDQREPIGVYTEMREDERGLYVEGTLAVNRNVPNADKAHALLKMGAVSGLSIGFNVPKGGEAWNDDADVWEISKVDLWETSIVTFPANRDAQVTEVRMLAVENMTVTEFEGLLRDAAGLTRRQAKALIAGGFSALLQRDADTAGDVSLSVHHLSDRLRRLTK